MAKKTLNKDPMMMDLLSIGEAMYREQPVYELLEFEEELRRRWHKKTGKLLDDSVKVKRTNRTKWRNLADFVKAYHTRYERTLTFKRGKKEYRVWLEYAGQIRGERLSPSDHIERVVELMAALP
jgi:hypothetical protein